MRVWCYAVLESESKIVISCRALVSSSCHEADELKALQVCMLGFVTFVVLYI